MDKQYAFLGDADGNLLTDDQLEQKLDQAVATIEGITDPDNSWETIKDMTESDIRIVFSLRRVNDESTFLVFGHRPLWFSKELIRAKAQRIVAGASQDSPIPENIAMMVSGHSEPGEDLSESAVTAMSLRAGISELRSYLEGLPDGLAESPGFAAYRNRLVSLQEELAATETPVA